jgi:hypothetical protein
MSEPEQLYARSWRVSAAAYPERSTLDDLLDVLVPRFAELAGYRGGYVLIDRDRGDVLATTFWDSLANLRAAQSRAANAAAGTLVISDGSSMEVSICDVLVSQPAPVWENRDLPGPG